MWFEKSTGKCLITSWTRKASNWYFKRCGLKKYDKKSTGNVLECHELGKQVTNIANVVVSKGTEKCLITSWTWKGSNWYFKRCGLKKYREKVRENVCITSCTRKASYWYFKRCGLKKYRNKVRENVLLHHVLKNK